MGRQKPSPCLGYIRFFFFLGVSPGKTLVLVNECAAYLVYLHFNVRIEEEPAIGNPARDGCIGKLPLITVASDN